MRWSRGSDAGSPNSSAMSSGSARPFSTSMVWGKHTIGDEEHARLPGGRLLRSARDGTSPSPRRLRCPRRAATRSRCPCRSDRGPPSENSAAIRAGPARSPPDTACTACTRPGFSKTLRRITLGRHAVVVAHADVRPRDTLRAAIRAQPAEVCVLGLGVRKSSGACSRMPAGIVCSISASSDGDADRLQHRVALGGVWTDVAGLKGPESSGCRCVTVTSSVSAYCVESRRSLASSGRDAVDARSSTTRADPC